MDDGRPRPRRRSPRARRSRRRGALKEFSVSAPAALEHAQADLRAGGVERKAEGPAVHQHTDQARLGRARALDVGTEDQGWPARCGPHRACSPSRPVGQLMIDPLSRGRVEIGAPRGRRIRYRLDHGEPGPHRSRGRRRHPRRDAAPGLAARADRLRELRLRGGAGGAGHRPHEQVRRGVSGQALLRRLRVRGRGGEPGHRAREAAVRRRPRQRAAALRRPGEHCRLHDRLQAGRHDPGHEPLPRRPPHPRPPAELLRPLLQGRGLRRAQGGRAHRLRGDGRAGPRAPAEGDRGGRERLPAHHRLRRPCAGPPTSAARW